jgi:hypothetical protein
MCPCCTLPTADKDKHLIARALTRGSSQQAGPRATPRSSPPSGKLRTMKTRASPRARGLHLYQARTRKAWHDELKSGHFFNLTKLSEKNEPIPQRGRRQAQHRSLQSGHSPIPSNCRVILPFLNDRHASGTCTATCAISFCHPRSHICAPHTSC